MELGENIYSRYISGSVCEIVLWISPLSVRVQDILFNDSISQVVECDSGECGERVPQSIWVARKLYCYINYIPTSWGIGCWTRPARNQVALPEIRGRYCANLRIFASTSSLWIIIIIALIINSSTETAKNQEKRRRESNDKRKFMAVYLSKTKREPRNELLRFFYSAL